MSTLMMRESCLLLQDIHIRSPVTFATSFDLVGTIWQPFQWEIGTDDTLDKVKLHAHRRASQRQSITLVIPREHVDDEDLLEL